MEKKYEFTGNTKVVLAWKFVNDNPDCGIEQVELTVHEIRALKSFDIRGKHIEKGGIGGYIESEESLSQYDNSWVDKVSVVCNGAIIEENSLLQHSRIVGDIRVRNTGVASSTIVMTLEETGHYLKNTQVSHSKMLDMIGMFVEGGELSNLNMAECGYIKTSGNIILKSLGDSHISVSGDAVFDNCHFGCHIEGEEIKGTFENVQFKSSKSLVTELTGTSYMKNCKLNNVLFWGGEETYKMENVSLSGTPHAILRKGTDWKDVTLRGRDIVFDEYSKMQNVHAQSVKVFGVSSELEAHNVYFENKTDFRTSGKTVILNGNLLPSRKKIETQGIRIYSTDLALIDAKIEGEVSIQGRWSIKNTTISDNASLFAEGNLHAHRLIGSILKEYGCIKVNKTFHPLILKDIQLSQDNILKK
ncbi:hypothetical protein JMA_39520 (plasmid) [Jeotgalibacillus malaysiensis]|uniref:Uncharacterized protein n=1 Tax=Jeotgalibacillus malaysiensis TaxID=1508404 RepID=A0A0B5ASU1_9BACL|nr:hypothetical protein [Jeotgalibacillus malaysiensis]AJD93270.1 hypothetical protein JMA_39520 [Jeotgalibacillus malaysiensis]